MAGAVSAAVGGETAVYVDTEGLSVDRLEAMIGARSDAVEDVASRIVVSEAIDFAEQQEAVRDVAELAERAGIVVVDSVTGFYRLERTLEGDDGEALRKIARQVTHLLGLARQHDLAVVVTNQVYTDPEADRTRPLGGHTLAHWSGAVLRLERFRGGNRRIRLEQHRSREAGTTARFRITEDGLESAEDPAAP
jgi:DNA repair protein RadB